VRPLHTNVLGPGVALGRCGCGWCWCVV
jgi:hypothetical protein